ncbi:MAG: site-specific DNA-methyltransferase [Bacteroidota bacterium]
MSNKQNKNLQKLELTWIGKGGEPKLEPRILIEQPEHSAGEADTNNMLIHGDNLLALKALEQEFSGRIKCIYIDPPFNTGQAFEYYDDNLEHSIWLNLLYQRIKILYKLLHKDGLFWIHLDDVEVHYCKVLLDEIFTRGGFVSHITYERSAVAGLGQGGYLVDTTEHLLLYKKGELPSKTILSYRDLEFKTIKRYNKLVVSKGHKKLVREFNSKSNDKPVRVFEHQEFEIQSVSLKDFEKREKEIRTFYSLNLDKLFRGNRVQKENAFQNDLISQMDKQSLYSVEYTPSRGKYKDQLTTLYYYNKELLSWLSDTALVQDNKVVKSQKLTTLWTHKEIPKADIANEGGVYFPRGKKPEQLIRRIIEMSTEEGDYILDSFLGSGTTAAVAHKMGRNYIGIEFGDQIYTHSLPRLSNIIKGKELTGVTKVTNWQGGGGFKFYTLAPSLLKKDKYGNWIIDEQYNADMLAAAMAKQEGFRYQPDMHLYWKQGQSTEKDFIYTTTQFVTVETLDQIHDEMQADQSLLICCRAFQQECKRRHSNITIKKIPHMLLGRCEFGKEDYSLNIIDMPEELDVGNVDFAGEEDTRSIQEINQSENKGSGQQSLF